MPFDDAFADLVPQKRASTGNATPFSDAFSDLVPKAPRPPGALGYVNDAMRSVANGATFGFADKLAAKGNELLGYGTYEQNLAQERARDAQIPAVINIPGEIGGAVLSAYATAPLRAGMSAITGLTKLPGWIKAIGGGAGSGALFGAGNSEPGQEASDAAIGAGIGALAGSKLPGWIKAIGGGAVGGALFGAGNSEPGQEASGAAQGAGIGALAGGVAYPVVKGVGALATAVKDAVNPQANVAADLGRALARDNMTPEQLSQRAAELNAIRPGTATLADAGGENVRGLVERVAQTPGAGRTTIIPALTDRQKQQMARLTMDLASLTGSRRTALQATQETMAARAEAAAPLYQQAYQDGEKEIWSPALERLSSSPTIQRAMKRAVNMWRDNAVADGYGAMNPGAMVGGGGKLPAFPNLQFWDYTKRILDDQIGAAVRAGENQKARTLTTLAQSLRSELDQQVPSYAAARRAWGGPSQYLDAIEEGGKIASSNLSGEQLRANLAEMTPAQREGYVIGAISALRRKMGSDAAETPDLTKYLRSPEMREKIAALMPTPEAAQEWEKRLQFEIDSSKLFRRATGNNATARREAELEDAGGIPSELAQKFIGSAVRGHLGLTDYLVHFAKSAQAGIRDTLRSRSDAILADLLTRPDAISKPLTITIPRRSAQQSMLPSSASTRATEALTENR
jgi:hypothetical protein